MGKSSEQFIMQKQFELMEMSSRELKDYANTQLEAILKHSEPNEVLSKSVRLEKYLTELNSGLKKRLENLESVNGVEFSEGNRTTLNFKEDSEWLNINLELKRREELLKARSKLGKSIYDDEGVEVPLISSSTTTFITIKVK
jgi:hypothetical protein